MKRLIRSLGVALIALLVTASPAMAIAEPTSVTLDDIELFQNLLVTGDMLAVVPYSVTFTTKPDENIDKTFIFRMTSVDGTTEYGTALAYPAYNGGYGSGIVSFYFADNTTVTWGETYVFRVQQNPTYYPSAQYWDFTIDSSAYSDAFDQTEGLKAKVIDSATFLTTEFGVALLSKSESGATILSTYGELYYLTAIPGLQQMVPYLFSVQLENPDFAKRTWSTIVAVALVTKYSGTFIGDFMTGFGGLWGTTTSAAMTTLSIFMVLVIIGLSIGKFKGTMLTAMCDGYALILLLMLIGFFPMVAAGGIAFCSIVLGGVILFLNRA